MQRIFHERRIDSSSVAIGPDGEQFEVLIPETNQDDSTYDGIDWGGERVAEEVSDRRRMFLFQHPRLTFVLPQLKPFPLW